MTTIEVFMSVQGFIGRYNILLHFTKLPLHDSGIGETFPVHYSLYPCKDIHNLCTHIMICCKVLMNKFAQE
jgi:hypothetical protein